MLSFPKQSLNRSLGSLINSSSFSRLFAEQRVSAESKRRSPENEKLIQQALTNISKQNFPEAVKYAKEAATKGDYMGYILLANYHMMKPKPEMSEVVKNLQEAIKLDSTDAMLIYGQCLYRGGPGIPRDEAKAIELFKQAEDLKNPQAPYNLGLIFKSQNKRAEAAREFKKGLELGNRACLFHYVECTLDGSGKPTEEGLMYLRQGAQINDPDCLEFLGKLDDNYDMRRLAADYGTAKHKFSFAKDYFAVNFEEIVPYIKIAAMHSHPEATRFYHALSSVPRVKKQVDELTKFTMIKASETKKKADSGDVESQYLFAMMITTGVLPGHVMKKEAMKYFQMAADQKHPMACMRLALMLNTGEGGKQNTEDALKYMKMAADAGVAEAKFRLSLIAKNEDDAKRLMKEAAEKGHYLARLMSVNKEEAKKIEDGLRNLYKAWLAEWGLDPKIEPKFMYEGYKKAAEAGNPDGQFVYSRMLAKGDGVAKDSTESLKWLKLAAAQKQPEALATLAKLNSSTKIK